MFPFLCTPWVIGQVPEDSAGDDAKAQAESVLNQIDLYLHKAGTDKTKLLSATVYLTSMDHYNAMNEAWEAWMPKGFAPARATVGNVSLARPQWKIEIVVIAAL